MSHIESVLTLSAPRNKVDALDFMKATTELIAWQDPERVSCAWLASALCAWSRPRPSEESASRRSSVWTTSVTSTRRSHSSRRGGAAHARITSTTIDDTSGYSAVSRATARIMSEVLVFLAA